MYLILPKDELKNLLISNNSQIAKDFGDDLLQTIQVIAGKNHFYFNATCINTSSEGIKKIHQACENYLKLCFLAYIYAELFYREDLFSDIFGDTKLSIDFFDKYWELHYPFFEINTDNTDETLINFKDKFIFPDDSSFEIFLSRLGLNQ